MRLMQLRVLGAVMIVYAAIHAVCVQWPFIHPSELWGVFLAGFLVHLIIDVRKIHAAVREIQNKDQYRV